MNSMSDHQLFTALLAQSGMDVPPEQLASLFEGYRHMLRQIALIAAPLAFEAEPAVTFTPDAQ